MKHYFIAFAFCFGLLFLSCNANDDFNNNTSALDSIGLQIDTTALPADSIHIAADTIWVVADSIYFPVDSVAAPGDSIIATQTFRLK